MGYTDRLSAKPGDTVRLFVSSSGRRWTAELVRLLALEIPSRDIPRRAEPVPDVVPVGGEAMHQRSPVGSYVRVDGRDGDRLDRGLTVSVFAMPTLPGHDEQIMLSQRTADGSAGWSLGLSPDGRPHLCLATDTGPAELFGTDPLVTGTWYRLTAVIDPVGGAISLSTEAAGTFCTNRVVTGRAPGDTAQTTLAGTPVAAPQAPILLGCGWLESGRYPARCYDGRLEGPLVVAAACDPGASPERLIAHPELRAAWDASAGIGRSGIERPAHLHDIGPDGRHGRCVNHPARAVTGHDWVGDIVDFRFAPEQYSAIHFHRTDMTDCAWRPQAAITLPGDLASGVYAFVLRSDDGHADRVPLIVRPPDGTATAPALLVLSTNSYLAYGNDHTGVDSPRTQVWDQMVPALDDFELFRDAQRELGLSMYETHPDGFGVWHSSWRRPLLTMRATAYNNDGPVWQFSGDMQLIDWLDRTGRNVDVVCDRDLHEQGAALLARYACVMTGTHPEYPSAQMLDAYEQYVSGGGRLMYMGGNGMYWVTGYDPEDEQVVEIRRWGGTQAWLAPPGEYHLSCTGELGGLWRFRGRAPQKTFGVGFVAAGRSFASAGYVRQATGSSTEWVFSELSGDRFGREGTSGGAAGLEIDSVDTRLGTPESTIVLATSVGHPDEMLEARENFNMTSRVLGGARNPKVHADLVLIPREHGGAVFSTGSIAFAGALANDKWDGDVSRLLGNVFDRFVSGAPVLDESRPDPARPA
jgi:N,N-dimethylformamidase